METHLLNKSLSANLACISKDVIG